MSHQKISTPALQWSTIDLANHLEELTPEQQEAFKNRFGESPRDYRIYLEAFFESIQDGLIEQINNDLRFQIQEDINLKK